MQVGLGKFWCGEVGSGTAGWASLGNARFGGVRQVWQGAVLCGTEWLGNAGKQLGEKHE